MALGVFLNPNLTPEQAMSFYERSVNTYAEFEKSTKEMEARMLKDSEERSAKWIQEAEEQDAHFKQLGQFAHFASDARIRAMESRSRVYEAVNAMRTVNMMMFLF